MLPESRFHKLYDGVVMALLLAPSLGGMWYYGASQVWSFSAPLMLAAVGTTLFLARLFLFRGVTRVKTPPGGWAALVLAALFLVWIPFAPVRYYALLQAIKAASAVMAYWVWADMAGAPHRWRWLVGLLIASVAMMGLYALVQHARGAALVLALPRPEVYGMRASGAFICPNHFAHLLVMILCLCLALIPSRAAGGVLRLLAIYALVVLLPALYLSQSRSGWLGLLAGGMTVAAAFAWRAGARRFILAALILPVLAAVIAVAAWQFLPLVRHRVEVALQGDMRPPVWKDTWSMAMAKPWFGWGPGSYRWVFPTFRSAFTRYLEPRNAHNEYLDALAETGALGFLLHLAPYLLAFGALVGRLRAEGHDRESMLAAGALGALAGTAVHAFFDFNLQIFANLQTLMLIGGIAVAGWTSARTIDQPAWPGWKRGLVAGSGAALCVFISIVAYCSWQAWRLDEEGKKRHDALLPEDARQLHEKAMAFAPWYDRPYIELGHIDQELTFWERDAAEKQRVIGRAMANYEKAARLNAWDPEIVYGHQLLLKNAGRLAESNAELEALVKKFPYQVFYLTEWGERLSDLGRYREALAFFRRAHEISPSPKSETYLQWLPGRIASQAQVPLAPP